MRTCVLCTIFAFILVSAFQLQAAEPFYLGTWKIASAVEAPWVEKGRKADPEEMKFLVGQTVVFKPGEITGPRQVACRGPKSKVVTVPAEGLFQGAFDEMHRNDPKVNPLKIANQLGFSGSSWKTVQTGCANEVDWHFVDLTTTTFGLNDYVYFLKKQ